MNSPGYIGYVNKNFPNITYISSMNVGEVVDDKLKAGTEEKEKKTRKRTATFQKQVKKGVLDMKVGTGNSVGKNSTNFRDFEMSSNLT